MRYNVLIAAVGLLAASASMFGQAGLTGKWQTDSVPAALEAQKNAPAAPEGGGRGPRGPQAIILDLQVDGSGKISGTVNEIGNDPILKIETGSIMGKTITWVTQPRGVTWNLEMTDDDTVTLTGRVIPARVAPPTAPAPPAAGAAATGSVLSGAPAGGGRGFGRGPQQPIVFHRVKQAGH